MNRDQRATNFSGSKLPESGESRVKYSVFIGGISHDTTEAHLRDLFTRASSIRIQRERDSGKSRGFGFVDFHSVEEAKEAIRQFDGYEIHGRRIRVSEASKSQSSDSIREFSQSGYLRNRSRSRDRTAMPNNLERTLSSDKEIRRRRMQNLRAEAGAGWDRRPTPDELRAQEEEKLAILSAHSRGEITTIRADLQKAFSSKHIDRR